ncbi:MAG TPA: hypothetical protein VN249_05825 [Prolixibacteraceae bacterium]|nr:hypothetical protein [Prolixibacteraceae bacterium]
MKKNHLYSLGITLLLLVVSQNTIGQSAGKSDEDYYRDLYADTWVASDALGRKMPVVEEVGPVKTGKRRFVSIFYITWHTQDHYKNFKSPYSADVTKIYKADPAARLDAKHPLWTESSYHWGEPEMGYFLSQDEYVIRKDMSMLADAGVDVLVMDVTNAVRYWDEWEVLFKTMQKMKAEGNKVPQFCFWAFNGQVITVVQDLYDRIYKTKKFTDLWFYWDGKPLILYNGNPKFDANGQDVKQPNPHYDPAAKTDVNNPHYGDPDYSEEFYKDYTKEVKNFFTKRTMWWGYDKWAGSRFVGTEDNWSFGYDLGNKNVKAMNPDDLVSTHQGVKEEAAVTPAQHPSSLVGKSWRRETGEPPLNQYDIADSAYVPWLGRTVKNPEGYGIYFQDRWDEALKSDPDMLYINDWNEWTAGKYQKDGFNFMRRKSPFFFVDQYNSEFNRCVQPMKDGYTDNYYMQMAQNIRRYKGVRPIPEQQGVQTVKIDGKFDDWKNVANEFRDTRGDVFHRDHNGYGGLHYKNESGRNDIITSKVAVDKQNVSFYAGTAGKLTPSNGKEWMLLLIDADHNPETGWFGYDFIINKSVKDEKSTTLMRYDGVHPENPWIKVADLNYRYADNELEVTVPRKLLGLTDSKFTFDFKWSDNASDLKDPISLCTDGDTAPNRRFNYRCIWKK